MISRIKNNFTELMESLVNKKDEILKQNKIINFDNLLSFYEENKKIFEKLCDQLESKSYDYEMILFNGNDELPRWAGYSLGYYLVKRYLERTGKKIEKAFFDNYADFRER